MIRHPADKLAHYAFATSCFNIIWAEDSGGDSQPGETYASVMDREMKQTWTISGALDVRDIDDRILAISYVCLDKIFREEIYEVRQNDTELNVTKHPPPRPKPHPY